MPKMFHFQMEFLISNKTSSNLVVAINFALFGNELLMNSESHNYGTHSVSK